MTIVLPFPKLFSKATGVPSALYATGFAEPFCGSRRSRNVIDLNSCEPQLIVSSFSGINSVSNSKHLIPSEARYLRLGMTAIVNPAGPGFYKHVSTIGDILPEEASLIAGHHQRIRHDHEFVALQSALAQLTRAKDIERQIALEEHAMVAGDRLMNRCAAALLVVSPQKGNERIKDDRRFRRLGMRLQKQIRIFLDGPGDLARSEEHMS